MEFLIFDTETTGLPINYRAPWDDYNNWPRITQLAFMLVNEKGEELTSFQSLIKPDGWVIPEEPFFIENNMSTERCEEEGIPIFDALRQLQNALKLCDYKVAHNIAFDNSIVGSELMRAGIVHQLFQFKRGICTMMKTTNFVKEKSHAGGNKWPKLVELHRALFGFDFDNAHDAMADVRATKECFIECLNRGIIKL